MIEPRFNGTFWKFINNDGTHIENTGAPMHLRKYLDAFCHYTYLFSKKEFFAWEVYEQCLSTDTPRGHPCHPDELCTYFHHSFRLRRYDARASRAN